MKYAVFTRLNENWSWSLLYCSDTLDGLHYRLAQHHHNRLLDLRYFKLVEIEPNGSKLKEPKCQ